MPDAPPLFRPAWYRAPKKTKAKARTLTGERLQRTRKRLFEMQPLCAVCHRAPSEELDHIIPLSKGGDDGWGNLQGLCKPCHVEKTSREGRDRSRSAGA
jgi:5-methylcytosine-specific restriction enzyme A